MYRARSTRQETRSITLEFGRSQSKQIIKCRKRRFFAITQAHAIRASFASAVEDWIGEVERGCLTRDLDHQVLLTSTPLERALWEYFIRRAQLY